MRAPEGTPLYVHLPFCAAKCTYCDFFSLPAEGHDLGALVDDLLAEARMRAPERPRTVFLGGGTPSLLPGELLVRLLDGLEDLTGFRSSAEEVTAECNPESLDREKAELLGALGVGRLSIGIQSLDPRALELFGRVHDAEQGLAAVEAAAAARVGGRRLELSADLIYAWPGQTPEGWERELRTVLALGTGHLSAYDLAYEEGTQLTAWAAQGRLEPASEERELELFWTTRRIAEEASLGAYEVSNFARSGRECRHNTNYWHNGPYLGLGPSAVSRVGPRRWGNPRSLGRWAASVRAGRDPVEWEETPPAAARLAETWWLGLRLAAGVDPRAARATSGWEGADDPALETARGLGEVGLLEEVGGRWRLTRAGLPLADGVARRFLDRAAREPVAGVPGA